jgi:hypothetical protein
MGSKFYRRIVFIIIFFTSFIFPCKSQLDEALLKLVSNKNIGYELALSKSKNYGNDEISVSIEIIHISSFDLDSLVRKNSKPKLIYSLIKLMDNPVYDWGANLLLYPITRRLAITIILVKSESELRNSFKKKGLEYWRSFFDGINFSKI